MSSKKKTAASQAVQQKTTFYVVAVEKLKQVNGIIGALDLYNISILLEDGTHPPCETVPAKATPTTWYTDYLKTQDIHVKGAEVLGDNTCILYVDTEKTVLSEFLNVKDCDDISEAKGSYAWKTYMIPCHAGTFKESLGSHGETRNKGTKVPEALGFWICAQKEQIGAYPLSTLVEKAFNI